jgi:hypothetical protein
MTSDDGSAHAARTGPLLSSWVARTLILAGSAGIAVGTALPVVSQVYLGRPFSSSGWNVTYLYWPRFAFGVIPLAGALVAFGIAVLSGRRRIRPHRALAPAAVALGDLGFFWYTYAFGHLGAQIHADPRISSSGLGLGFVLMVGAALLVAAAAIGADPSPPRARISHIETSLTAALVAFAVLMDPMGGPVAGAILCAATLAAGAWMARLFRRSPPVLARSQW